MVMKRIAARLPDVQLILMCGHNRLLADQLRAQRTRAPQAPRVVVEFTPDVPHYMRIADFFIGKPGPGSLSEALRLGLPVVTTLNAWTMPQERYNARWVRERQLGVVCTSVRSLRAAVLEVIERLPELRAQVAGVDNRAVYELPAIFEELLSGSGAAPRWQPPAPLSRDAAAASC